ncbi:hypothetical protein DIPPA_02635 [Diplonema papillatum]|nr:hypothetical protein DIPPA_02635 [Diplonema papillatum]
MDRELKEDVLWRRVLNDGWRVRAEAQPEDSIQRAMELVDELKNSGRSPADDGCCPSDTRRGEFLRLCVQIGAAAAEESQRREHGRSLFPAAPELIEYDGGREAPDVTRRAPPDNPPAHIAEQHPNWGANPNPDGPPPHPGTLRYNTSAEEYDEERYPAPERSEQGHRDGAGGSDSEGGADVPRGACVWHRQQQLDVCSSQSSAVAYREAVPAGERYALHRGGGVHGEEDPGDDDDGGQEAERGARHREAPEKQSESDDQANTQSSSNSLGNHLAWPLAAVPVSLPSLPLPLSAISNPAKGARHAPAAPPEHLHVPHHQHFQQQMLLFQQMQEQQHHHHHHHHPHHHPHHQQHQQQQQMQAPAFYSYPGGAHHPVAPLTGDLSGSSHDDESPPTQSSHEGGKRNRGGQDDEQPGDEDDDQPASAFAFGQPPAYYPPWFQMYPPWAMGYPPYGYWPPPRQPPAARLHQDIESEENKVKTWLETIQSSYNGSDVAP